MKYSKNQVNLSTGGGLVAILLWSTTVAIARHLSEQLGPLTAGACVYLIGGAFCLASLIRRWTAVRELLRGSPRYVLGCGFLFVVYTAVLFLAVGLAADRLQTLEVGLVNYLWPTATILFSLLFLGQRANLLLLPGTVLALAGEFLVITQGDSVSWGTFREHLTVNPAPYALAFVAAVSWGLYSTLARRWSRPETGGAVDLFIPAAGLTLLILSLLSGESPVWSAWVIGEAAVLGAVTVGAYALWDAAMRKGNLMLVAACSYFTPLLSTLVSCAYLRVEPGWRLWVGCLMLVIGSLLTWHSVSGRSSREQNA